MNNDTSRAPKPENLTGAQAEVDPKPGATKTEPAESAAAGGKPGVEPSAPEKGRQAAGAQAADRDAGSEKAGTKARAAADGEQPETPGGDAGKPAAAATGQRADEANDAGDDTEPDAEAGDDEPEAAEANGKAAEAEGTDEDEAEAAATEDEEPRAATPGADEPTADDEATPGADEPTPDDERTADDEPTADEEEPSEAVLAELVSARAEAEGYLDDLRRLQAEFDNYRKRTMREQTARIASASQALVSRLLPVLDNFELAVSHAEQSRDFDRMLKGVEMVFGELNDLLAGEGLVAIEASGKPFDPERHEAVVAVEEDGIEAGTVLDVIRKGYEFNGRVLRPAMVKVAR